MLKANQVVRDRTITSFLGKFIQNHDVGLFRGGAAERAKNRISIGGKISKIALKSTISN